MCCALLLITFCSVLFCRACYFCFLDCRRTASRLAWPRFRHPLPPRKAEVAAAAVVAVLCLVAVEHHQLAVVAVAPRSSSCSAAALLLLCCCSRHPPARGDHRALRLPPPPFPVQPLFLETHIHDRPPPSSSSCSLCRVVRCRYFLSFLRFEPFSPKRSNSPPVLQRSKRSGGLLAYRLMADGKTLLVEETKAVVVAAAGATKPAVRLPDYLAIDPLSVW